MKRAQNLRVGRARGLRLFAEALELRLMFSVTPLVSTNPAVTLFPAATGAANLALAADGSICYTAGNTLQRVSADGQSSTVIHTATDSSFTVSGIAAVVLGQGSGIGLSLGSGTWLTVSDGSSSRIEQITASGQLLDSSTVTGSSTDNLLVSGNTVWFTQGNNTIGHLTSNGQTDLFTVPAARELSGVAAGPDGNVWFAGEDALGHGMVGRVTPDGDVKTINIGAGGGAAEITAGGDGTLYFGGGDAIWRLAGDGAMTKIMLPGIAARDLSPGTDGALWFVDAKDAMDPISRLDADGDLSRYASGIPGEAMPNSLVVAPDGDVWFTAQVDDSGVVGRLDVSSATPDAVVVTSAVTATVGLSMPTGQILSADIGAVASVETVVPRAADRVSVATIPVSEPAKEDTTEVTAAGDGADAQPRPVESTADVRESTFAAIGTVNTPVKSAAMSSAGSDADDNGGATKQAADDPGTFEGEFSIVKSSAMPPREMPQPDYYRYEYSSGKKVQKDASAVLSTASGQEIAKAQAMPEVGDGKSKAILAVPGHDNVAIQQQMAALPVALAVNDSPVRAQMASYAKWWRLAVCISAVTGLQVWRRDPARKPIDESVDALKME